jgi:hypothetical protein
VGCGCGVGTASHADRPADGRELTGPVTGVVTLAFGRFPLSSAAHSFTIRMPFEAPFSAGLIDLTGLTARPVGSIGVWGPDRVLTVAAARGFMGAGHCAASRGTALRKGVFQRSDKPLATARLADDTAPVMAITFTADLQQRTVSVSFNGHPIAEPLFTNVRDLEHCTPFVTVKSLSAGAAIRIDSEDE